VTEPPDRSSSTRVVSLVPSVTETLFAWGLPPIGCTRFCERPELPHVGGTKDPDVAAIVALQPDLVVMCEEENRKEDAEALAAAGVPFMALAVDSVDDVAPALATLADHLGVEVEQSHAIPDRDPEPRLKAFVPIWKRPWMSISAGTYGSSLLNRIGVANVCAAAEERYPEVDLEQVAAAGPDVVLAPSEPYPFAERHVPLLEQVAPVVLVDGQDLFWWGIRTPAALARLRTRLVG
jgi:ABC-type Fe3+-hydroxamate transport system substrate-binding protein